MLPKITPKRNWAYFLNYYLVPPSRSRFKLRNTVGRNFTKVVSIASEIVLASILF